MRRTTVVFVFVLLAVVAVTPLVAGEKHAKCEGSAQDCLDKMVTKLQDRAWLGINYEPTDDGGWRITEVVAASPAEAAGLQKGDVILGMNGVVYATDGKEAAKEAWSTVGPGSKATYLVERSGSKIKIQATLGAMPENIIAQIVGEHLVASHSRIRMASKD